MAILANLRLPQHSILDPDHDIYNNARARVQAKSQGKDNSDFIINHSRVNSPMRGQGFEVLRGTFQDVDNGFKCDIVYGSDVRTIYVLTDLRVFI